MLYSPTLPQETAGFQLEHLYTDILQTVDFLLEWTKSADFRRQPKARHGKP